MDAREADNPAVEPGAEPVPIPDKPAATGTKRRRRRRKGASFQRLTCARATREAIARYHPAAESDPVLFRYVVHALFSTWRDRDTGLRIIGQDELEWIWGEPFGGFTWGTTVLARIEAHLPGFRWAEYHREARCRLIEEDGLDPALREIAAADLGLPARELEDRVYVTDGRRYHRDHPTQTRAECLAACDALVPPSETARRIQHRLNHRPSNVSARILRRIDEARRYVEAMDIEVDLKPKKGESEWARERRAVHTREGLRSQYLAVLRAIEDQHQPLYKPSRRGRTDRLFGYNPSALHLPSDVREILYQGFVSIDLKSAHLFIAAKLWNVDDVVERLTDPEYSVWDDLLDHLGHGHLRHGDPLYRTLKGALKTATYSVIYGMAEHAVKGEFTKAVKEVLGPDAGRRLACHWLIRRLLDARDRALGELNVGEEIDTPTGIRVRVEQELGAEGSGVDPRSAMATVAQAYEQELMSVVLEYEADHHREAHTPTFHVALWLHDGCYAWVPPSRSAEPHLRELRRRLQERADQLGVYARLEDEVVGAKSAQPAEAPE